MSENISPNGPAKPTVDLLVSGQYVLPMHEGVAAIEQGAVAIAGDTIVEVGAMAELGPRYPGARRLTHASGLVMPGLVNVHTHAAMAMFRGLADDLPLMQWLQEHIFPAEARLTAEMVYHSTRLSTLEMIRSGTTSFCDMYLFAADVARAAAESGMRAWVGEVLYDFPSPNYGPVAAGLEYLDRLAYEYAGHARVTITVDPHAVYTCSPDLLLTLKERARALDALYVIHLSESAVEVANVMEKFGRTPVMHLDALGLLDSRVLADHCVVLTEAEIELLAARRVKVAHCPESNMKLASGVAPVVELLTAGVTVGLGTDGAASNNNVDLFGEMDTAAKLHKVHRLDPTVMPAAAVLRMATLGGAEALGAGQWLGSLASGKKADLIVVDLAQPHLTPLYNIPSQLVYAARGADVVHSVINGRIVMQDRRITTMDESEVLAKVREISSNIKQ